MANAKKTKNLTKAEQKDLYEALHFMKMKELKDACDFLGLTVKGRKNSLIEAVFGFVTQGRAPIAPVFPSQCKSVAGRKYPFSPETLILKGSFKCDAATRAFFKKLIGPHFHFTAFGIDWVNERWYSGNPPTYQEFAKMWEKEYLRRKTAPAKPKKEWAYLTFLQKAKEENPSATREETLKNWEKKREGQAKLVWSILLAFQSSD